MIRPGQGCLSPLIMLAGRASRRNARPLIASPRTSESGFSRDQGVDQPQAHDKSAKEDDKAAEDARLRPGATASCAGEGASHLSGYNCELLERFENCPHGPTPLWHGSHVAGVELKLAASIRELNAHGT